jgi:RNA polymerase sigma factor (TIGR02999 family)
MTGDVALQVPIMTRVDGESLDRLFPVVYDELRRRAHSALGRAQPGQTLSTTALVHETYLRFKRSSGLSWNDRGHFLAVAARAMRQILVDYSRRRRSLKRTTEAVRIELAADMAVDRQADGMLALDAALTELATLNPRLVQMVELRYFAGLSLEEAAKLLAVSARTAKRDWRKAKAFLYDSLGTSAAIRSEPHERGTK